MLTFNEILEIAFPFILSFIIISHSMKLDTPGNEGDDLKLHRLAT